MARGKKKESALTPEEKLAQALVPDWDQPYKVPENWCWTRLKTISAHISDGSHNPPKDSGSGIPLLSATNIRNHSIDVDGAVRWITEAEWETENQRTKIEPNDVLLTIVATLGRTAVVRNEKFALQRSVAVIKPRVNSEFLSYYFETPYVQTFIVDNAKGTAQKGFYLNSLENLFCCVPPLVEQRRIVDRIEYLFAKLDEAKEKAQSVLDSFETRKAAILHKAFTGELTAQWRAEHGVSDDSWSTVDITRIAKTEKDALKAGPFGSALKKSMYVPEGYKIYGQEQVIAGDETIGDYYIDESKYQELISCKIAPHDILISLVGTVGKVLVLSDACKPGIINPRLIKVSLDERIMMPYFFKYYFESDSLKEKYKGESHGITMDVLNMRILKMLPFPLCTLDEQAEIVRILDSLLAKEQQAKEAAEAVLEKIDLLKKSILARAFRGELGTNDPNEVSACELLGSVL